MEGFIDTCTTVHDVIERIILLWPGYAQFTIEHSIYAQ